MHKDLRKMVKALEKQGFTVRQTKNNHYNVTRDGAYIVTLPGTPSDWRSMKNALAALRRGGFIWP